jgi:hypothetical protein
VRYGGQFGGALGPLVDRRRVVVMAATNSDITGTAIEADGGGRLVSVS